MGFRLSILCSKQLARLYGQTPGEGGVAQDKKVIVISKDG